LVEVPAADHCDQRLVWRARDDYVDPSPTFYRYNLDGAQWQAGLGDYIYNVKHYKKIATISEDYSFVYTQVLRSQVAVVVSARQ
jgi:hypothetical protein